jgi:tetratricopeptide (TPR) repeat protein
MTWLGWILLIFAFYLAFVLAKGIYQFFYWLFEDTIEDWRERRRQAARATSYRERHREGAAGDHKNEGSASRTPRPPGSTVRRAPQHSSGIGKLSKLLKLALGGKSFDYWVSCAMVEQDAKLKIQFLNKAVQRNPTYAPAWVMKGNALYESKRYAEALECYAKALELHPAPLIRYKKGLCCHQLQRPQEAIESLAKALAECHNDDRELAEEIRRTKRQLEAELQANGAS